MNQGKRFGGSGASPNLRIPSVNVDDDGANVARHMLLRKRMAIKANNKDGHLCWQQQKIRLTRA